MPSAHAGANHRAAAPRWLRYLIKHRLAYLLALEAFAIFAIAPLIEMGMLPHLLLGGTFTLILLSGMLMVDHRARVGRVLIGLGIVLLPIQLWRYLVPRRSGARAASDRPALLSAGSCPGDWPTRYSAARGSRWIRFSAACAVLEHRAHLRGGLRAARTRRTGLVPDAAAGAGPTCRILPTSPISASSP